METTAQGRIRLTKEGELHTEGSSSDRISNLPEEVLHHIISFLPIQSIAQTSILSKRWSHLWASLPILDFSDLKQREVEFVNTVLRHRDENSNIKVFRVKGDLSSSCLYNCIDQAVKYRVEKLKLDVSLTDKYFFGDKSGLLRLFNCDSLRSLKLAARYSSYAWQRPLSSQQFPISLSYYVVATIGVHALRTLCLTSMKFLDSTSELDLFSASSFPSLEKLRLENCIGITHLKITCPKIKDVHIVRMFLKCLDISGMRLESLEITHAFEGYLQGSRVNILAPNLQSFYWGSISSTEESSITSFPTLKTCHLVCSQATMDMSMAQTAIVMSMAKTIVNLLCSSSQVQNLCIVDGYLRILSRIDFEGGLPYSFMELKTLQIFVDCLNKAVIPGLACLFKTSRILHTLSIYIWHRVLVNDSTNWQKFLLDDVDCTEERYWENEAQNMSHFLRHLKVVNIHHYPYVIDENVITFAKFLLQHGEGLQEMLFNVRDSKGWEDKISLLKELPWANGDVKISFSVSGANFPDTYDRVRVNYYE
ncbi:putative F-box/FBD/LRR-repeat protein At4g03220 [Pyrus x bretschneideri]|uniref:putative F-box/FBD/LRR-repeat protein At4g03220 n=1 Tax=Pyrus x bretschneideri TaxID=225117 RepID=UPI0020303990|nr:putative F-box/FBD/LRR-repeat protein At4g03220 [Pyrus x bretschneideri]